MKSKMKKRVSLSFVRLAAVSAVVFASLQSFGQAPSRFLGTITAINGTTLTVKTDAGDVRQVEVPAAVQIKRVAPGQKDLSSAEAIQFGDLANGDRVLVKVDPNAAGSTPQALQIIAIKQMDVAAKQEKDRQDWQRRGIGGLVKSVDVSTGVIQVTVGAGPTAKTVAVHTTQATLLKRYAPASVQYDTAKPAPITAILAGDQLRARGTKNADGSEISADEVVSGSFRNISGTVTSTDAASSTLVVKDLATKKQVTIHILSDTQMRKLPDMMARVLAARLKGTLPARDNAGVAGAGANGGPPRIFDGGNGGPGGRDPQQMLSRAPSIQLGDLKKGDAVMLVSTAADSDVTAITLLAGVEPLLEAPAAQNLLSNWSMGGGAPEAAQ